MTGLSGVTANGAVSTVPWESTHVTSKRVWPFAIWPSVILPITSGTTGSPSSGFVSTR